MKYLSEEDKLFLRGHPEAFAEDILGHKIWSRQKEMLEAIGQHDKVCIGTGHSISKTYTAAEATLWFLGCFQPALVITTAPTGRQVRDQLWKEIRVTYNKPRIKRLIPGECLTQRLTLNENCFAIGFSTADKDRTAFQGFHSENLLLIIDEGSGVSREVWEGGMSMPTGLVSKTFVLGNRLDPFCEFEKTFTNPDWCSMIISSRESPNVTGEMSVPGLATPEWIADREREWGKDSILTKIRIEGLCPKEGLNTLIPLMWLERIKENESAIVPKAPFYAGLDVADVGADASVLTVLDREARHVASFKWHVRTPQVERNTIEKHKEFKFDKLVVDALGVGVGVYNHLAERKDFQDVVIPHKGSETSLNEIYANKRAEIWYWVYHALDNNEIPCMQDIGFLFQDLAGVRKEVDPKGKVKLESKETYVKRLGRSPDEGDAYTLAFKAWKYRVEIGIQEQDIKATVDLPEAVVMSDFVRDQEVFKP